LGSKLKYILFMFTSLKYSNVRLPPIRNIIGFSPMPKGFFPSYDVKVFRFAFKFFTANTLYGNWDDIDRWVKLQVLYPNVSNVEPARVLLFYLAEANRKFISKSVTNWLLKFLMLLVSSISFAVNFGIADDLSKFFNEIIFPSS
jgi:hypothetical protein